MAAQMTVTLIIPRFPGKKASIHVAGYIEFDRIRSAAAQTRCKSGVHDTASKFCPGYPRFLPDLAAYLSTPRCKNPSRCFHVLKRLCGDRIAPCAEDTASARQPASAG